MSILLAVHRQRLVIRHAIHQKRMAYHRFWAGKQSRFRNAFLLFFFAFTKQKNKHKKCFVFITTIHFGFFAFPYSINNNNNNNTRYHHSVTTSCYTAFWQTNTFFTRFKWTSRKPLQKVPLHRTVPFCSIPSLIDQMLFAHVGHLIFSHIRKKMWPKVVNICTFSRARAQYKSILYIFK